MRVFTDEEFNRMIAEIDRENASFDTLCAIAHKVLQPIVTKWCNSAGILRGRVCADDLLHDIQVLLILKTVTGFLRNNRTNGEINRDPDGFNNWLFRVACNYKNSVIRKLKRSGGNDIDIESLIDQPGDADEYFSEERDKFRRRQLNHAFNLVLDSDRQVYIVLTWLSLCLFVTQHEIGRMQATDAVLNTFRHRTLFEMWDFILTYTKTIPWLTVQPKQKQRIETALNTRSPNENTLLGDLNYEAFFMKKGGKATISDWVTRINEMIRRRTRYEAFDD